MNEKKKVRVELRKNRSQPPRTKDWTRQFQEHSFETEATVDSERVRAKGDLSRHRTIIQDGDDGMPAVKADECRAGRVIRVHGLHSVVDCDGKLYRCATRRLLKSLATDERNVVTTGDFVWIRPAQPSEIPTSDTMPEGMIERVEPRQGVLTRASRNREHVLVANVDQVLIVTSLFEPDLKPHLIDRYIATALKGNLRPIIALNKADLAQTAAFEPLVGAYWQLGIPTVLTSARTGFGVARLRELLKDRSTVLSGQSGVGKSSLLNAIQPELGLQVKAVSEVNQKGRHTTTTAELIKLNFGGWVVDTPGVRQLQLWATRPEEVEGYFPEFRPFVALCGFPDCTHTHEERCAVKRAVRLRQISQRRYTSYLGLYHGFAD